MMTNVTVEPHFMNNSFCKCTDEHKKIRLPVSYLKYRRLQENTLYFYLVNIEIVKNNCESSGSCYEFVIITDIFTFGRHVSADVLESSSEMLFFS